LEGILYGTVRTFQQEYVKAKAALTFSVAEVAWEAKDVWPLLASLEDTKGQDMRA
jgi:hypothetical protein